MSQALGKASFLYGFPWDEGLSDHPEYLCMHIQILEIPPVTAKPLDLSMQREAAFPKITNSHRFCSSKNQKRQNLRISNPSPSPRDGTALCNPKPREPPFHVRGMSAAPGSLVLQPFGVTWLISALFSQTTFPFPTAQEHTALLRKVSPWMELPLLPKHLSHVATIPHNFSRSSADLVLTSQEELG